eukprot:15022703-Alexandrium_andersonii.AAC.1
MPPCVICRSQNPRGSRAARALEDAQHAKQTTRFHGRRCPERCVGGDRQQDRSPAGHALDIGT